MPILRTMRVYLVRHAHSDSGDPDELRPLSARGRREARELGERLARLDRPPRTVVSSPLLRARETAAAIAKALGVEAHTDERLAPGANAALLADALDGADDPVVAVAHQPDCSEIVGAVTGRAVDFPPAACVELRLA